MDRQTFHNHLITATQSAFQFTSRFVHNSLPQSFSYVVLLNQSNDRNALKPGEHVYPHDQSQFGVCVGPLTADAVVELLWREGRVPEWIDISVVRIEGNQTILQLRCCGRFTDRAELLYYAQTAVCPFGCKGPLLPPDWNEGDARFDLHWNQGPPK